MDGYSGLEFVIEERSLDGYWWTMAEMGVFPKPTTSAVRVGLQKQIVRLGRLSWFWDSVSFP